MKTPLHLALLLCGIFLSNTFHAATTYTLNISDVKHQAVSGEITLFGEKNDVLERITFTQGKFSYTSEEKVLRIQIVSSDYRHRPSYVELTKKFPTDEVFLQFRSNELAAYYQRKLTDNSVEATSAPTDTAGFVAASFPGGRTALMDFLVKNLRMSDESTEYALSEKVVMRFQILDNGNIADIEVVKAIYLLNADAAIETFLKSPTWVPATKNGTPVESSYTFPLKFEIQ